MTDKHDKHDKLVEMALKSGAVNHFVQGLPDRYAFSLNELTAFASAHVASLCAEVEPVAYMWQHDETGRIGFVEHAPAEELEQWERINRPRRFVAKLYSDSTVAALKARVAELEGVIDSVLLDIDDDGVAEAQDIAILAMRNIRNGRPQYEGLDAALAAKGQA